MNDVSKNMEVCMHDVLNGLAASRAMAEILADQIGQANPPAASALRKFAEELWAVWTRHQPFLPTNADIYVALNPPTHDAQIQNSKGNAGNEVN